MFRLQKIYSDFLMHDVTLTIDRQMKFVYITGYYLNYIIRKSIF